MIYQVLQIRKDRRNEEAALNARILGEVDPVFFLSAYDIVAEIEAADLDEVFRIGNIGPEDKIARIAPMHSVSVGDVIRDNFGRCFVVSSIGFTRLGEKEVA
tara:strand:+ start:5185 stop:5490 length:306 start_codon:yes stop_codon:yes gene_type:complete